jgi:hypothetical protein
MWRGSSPKGLSALWRSKIFSKYGKMVYCFMVVQVCDKATKVETIRQTRLSFQIYFSDVSVKLGSMGPL